MKDFFIDQASDKLLQRIALDLKVLENKENIGYNDIQPFLDIDDFSRAYGKSNGLTARDVQANIHFLADEGYLTYITQDQNGKEVKIAFILTHKGRHRNEFYGIQILKYIIHNLVPICALLVAIIALVKSSGNQ